MLMTKSKTILIFLGLIQFSRTLHNAGHNRHAGRMYGSSVSDIHDSTCAAETI